MSGSSPASRVVIDAKSFRLGGRKFCPRGVTYGPFKPTPQTGVFPSRDQALRDLELIRQLGANVIRVYHVPPTWFLDLALAQGLRLMIDIPWARQLCFLERRDLREAAEEMVRQAARDCAGHPAVFAYSVANEIPAEMVRWYGPAKVARFLAKLIRIIRSQDAGALCTFASFPPTEFLHVREVDFLCFNVFLHDPAPFSDYLARLQMLAGHKPLVLSECGVDSIREGRGRQAELLSWQIEIAFRSGLAGILIYSFTDDWHTDGRQIEEWGFGITERDRHPKESFRIVQARFKEAPYFPLPHLPKVSVVIACRNGERTLHRCLDACCSIAYPDYEVILVDDGSTDGTAVAAQSYPSVRYLRQPPLGLSVARNTGIAAAQGEVIAFTDADCRPDSHWLYYLVSELLADGVAGAGGPNIPPPDDARLAAVVAASPGRPNHVMVTDRNAEHLPGCNMAFWKWALNAVGGFDPVFHRAGDDVDICWRILDQGWQLRFSAGGAVWHYHRSTIASYLSQQAGYGEAEAVLARKHPNYFTSRGASQWQGRIYENEVQMPILGRAVVYHGIFGSAGFQRIYQFSGNSWMAWLCSFDHQVCVTIPLLASGTAFPTLLPLGLASLTLSLASATVAGLQAHLPPNKHAFWSRGLLVLLAWLQPLVRGWARNKWKWTTRSTRPTALRRTSLPNVPWLQLKGAQCSYYTVEGPGRTVFLKAILDQLQEESWQFHPDNGWETNDVTVFGCRWTRIKLNTVAEYLGNGRQILHCRLIPGSTATFLWMLSAVTIVSTAISTRLTAEQPWWWMIWLLLPTLLGLALLEQRLVTRLLLAVVGVAADRIGLQEHLPSNKPTQPPPTKSLPSANRDELEELL
ncbi:MAG: glycosyltransferase [Limisphaerales bacterium]|jgi:GT2 family glycosyltransferase